MQKKASPFVLRRDVLAHRADVVADVFGTRRLDAGKDTHVGSPRRRRCRAESGQRTRQPLAQGSASPAAPRPTEPRGGSHYWHDSGNGGHIGDLEAGFVAGAARAPAACVARPGGSRGCRRAAEDVAAARVRRRGAGAAGAAREDDRPARVPAPGRRLRRVVQRALDDADPREAEDHAADVRRAHVRRDAAGREGGADRRAVHEAAVGRVRGRRRRGDPVVPRAHGERRRAARPRRACRIRGGCSRGTTSRRRR